MQIPCWWKFWFPELLLLKHHVQHYFERKMKVQFYDRRLNMFTCLCQEIVGEGKPDALHESFKLKTEKNVKSMKGYDQLWTPTMISPYLESFFTVRFWPECEVVIFGGTENKNMFLYKIMEVYERLLQQRLLIEIKLCSVIVCCTLYHNFWSPLWRMFNTSGDSLLIIPTITQQ